MDDLNIDILDVDIELIDKLKVFYSCHFDKTNRVFNSEYLKWFLIDNSMGRAKTVLIKHENIIIANMFIVPTVLTENNFNKKAIFVVDVLTHPKHRDKNLFIKMIRKLIEYAKENKLIIIGHPNKTSTPGWKRTKMTFNKPLESFLSKSNFYSKNIKRLIIKNKNDLLELNDKINEVLENSNKLIVKSDCNYLLWRYLEHPLKKYKIEVIFYKDIVIGVVVSYKYKLVIDRVVHYFIRNGYDKDVFNSTIIPKIYSFPNNNTINASYSNYFYLKSVGKKINYFLTDFSDENMEIDSSFVTFAACDN